MNARFAAVIGLDVGKTGHHACALDPDGEQDLRQAPPAGRGQLRDLFTYLREHGDVLMEPITIGALPIAVARNVGCAVAYLPGLAMRKAADLAHETTRALNRIRSLPTQIHPADPEVLVDRIFTAFSEQTVVVPATAAVELVIPRVAGQVKELKEQRATVAREVEAMLEDFSLAGVLMSMPGIGIKTPPRSSWPSAMAPHSRPQAISQPTPASRRSREDQGPRSGASSPPDPATNA